MKPTIFYFLTKPDRDAFLDFASGMCVEYVFSVTKYHGCYLVFIREAL